MFTSRRIATSGGGDKFRDEYSLAFDGSNDYVLTDFKPDYIHTNATIAFWVKMNDFSSDQYMGCHNNKRWYFGFSSAQMFFGVADNHNGSNLFTISPAPVAGQWLHYCVTAIDGTATGYINGIAQGNFSYTQSSSTNPDVGFTIAVQNRDSSLSGYMNCNISEIAQYNVGLTASQVKTIYNGREPYNHKEGVASGNLQAWHRMGDGALDRFNLICDETNATKGSNLTTNGDFSSGDLTGWTHHETYQFDTVEYDSGSIHVVSNGSNEGGNYQSVINTLSTPVLEGKVYEISYDITVNSGSMRINVMNGAVANQLGYSVTHTSSTSVKSTFIANSNAGINTSTHGVEIYIPIGTAGDINLDNVSLKLVNGNAGVMTNMDAIDIERYTP